MLSLFNKSFNNHSYAAYFGTSTFDFLISSICLEINDHALLAV